MSDLPPAAAGVDPLHSVVLLTRLLLATRVTRTATDSSAAAATRAFEDSIVDRCREAARRRGGVTVPAASARPSYVSFGGAVVVAAAKAGLVASRVALRCDRPRRTDMASCGALDGRRRDMNGATAADSGATMEPPMSADDRTDATALGTAFNRRSVSTIPLPAIDRRQSPVAVVVLPANVAASAVYGVGATSSSSLAASEPRAVAGGGSELFDAAAEVAARVDSIGAPWNRRWAKRERDASDVFEKLMELDGGE